MNASKIIPFAFLLSMLCPVMPVQTQQLDITGVNLSGLPTVRVHVTLTDNLGNIADQNGVQYTVIENGTPVGVDVSCPKAYNSVALVLDNSAFGLWIENILDSIRAGAHRFIDALGPNDECLIATFETIEYNYIGVDFTNDKSKLHDFINSIDISMNSVTPLYSVMRDVHNLIKVRAGSKSIVVLSKGGATLGIPSSEYRPLAESEPIPIYPILWEAGPGRYGDLHLQYFAAITGGKAFFIPSGELYKITDVFDAISSELHSTACIITYETSRCTDSLRHIQIEARMDDKTLTADTLVASPHRPDTLQLLVQSEITEIVPPKLFRVKVSLEPRLEQALPLSLSLKLHFNPDVLTLQLPIERDNSILEDSPPAVTNIEPGVYSITSEFFYPFLESGRFFELSFLVKKSDYSIPAVIRFEDISLTNGCTNTVIVHPDTVYVCYCEQPMAVEVQEALVAASEEVRVPVMLTGTPLVEKSLFTLHLKYDSDFLEPIGVDGVGAITENALLQWRIKNGDTLEVRADEEFDPAPGNVLFYVRFKVKYPKSATVSELSIPYMRAFSDCCYHQDTPGPNTILIDGLCDKIVRRRADFTLEPNSPNPARGETSFRFTVHEQERLSEAQATLTLYRSDGTVVSELYNNSVRPGEYAVPYNLSSLPAGTYYYTLSISGRVQTRSMVVVR